MADVRDRLLFGVWLAWAAFVLSHYYLPPLRAAAPDQLPSRLGLTFAAIAAVTVPLVILIARRPSIAPRARQLARTIATRLNGRRRSIVIAVVAAIAVPWVMVWPRVVRAAAGIAAPGFPAFGEAVARATVAGIGAGLVTTAALASGRLVLRLLGWQTRSRVEQLVFAWTTSVGVISFGSLLLAAAGVYRPLTVAALIGLLALTGIAARPATVTPAPAGSRHISDMSGATVAWLSVAGTALAYALVSALAPEKEFDALWYHLYLPRLWLEAGRPVDVVQEYISLYPLTWELVFGAGMTFGGAVGAKLLHFACLPLLALLVWRAAQRLEGVSAAAAAAFAVTTPTLLWEAGTTYVDLALALHGAAGCYALACYAERNERAWGTVAALQLGMAAATKHLGIVIAMIALALYALAVSARGRSLTSAVRRAAVLAILAAAVPTPWYVRAWLASGNPVFPELFGVFGAFPAGRWDALAAEGLERFGARFGAGRSPASLASLPWDVTIHGASFGGSLGPLFLVMVPALLIAPRRLPVLRWAAAGIAAYVAVWASPLSSFQLRFLMPIVPALALLAAAAAAAAGHAAGRRAATIATAGVVCLTALNLPPFVRLHEIDRAGWSGWLTHVLREPPLKVITGREDEASYLRRQVPSFAAWTAIDATLPHDARILTFSEGDQFYSHRWRIPSYAPAARPAVWGASAAQLAAAAAALRHLGITHVLFDRRELSPSKAGSLAVGSPGFRQACVSEFDDGRYWLCRVDYSRLPPAPAVGR